MAQQMAAAINLILLKFCLGDRKRTGHGGGGEISRPESNLETDLLGFPSDLAKEPGLTPRHKYHSPQAVKPSLPRAFFCSLRLTLQSSDLKDRRFWTAGWEGSSEAWIGADLWTSPAGPMTLAEH